MTATDISASAKRAGGDWQGFRSAVEVGGHKVKVRLPKTAREVLEYTAFLAVQHDASAIDNKFQGYSIVVGQIIQWAGRYVEGGEDWVDNHLTIPQTFELALAIVSACSLPKSRLDDIRQWAKIIGEGGCECIRCGDPERFNRSSQATKEKALRHCLYRDVDDNAVTLASHTRAAREGNLLDAPWFIYQIENAVKGGLWSGRRNKRRNEDKAKTLRSRIGGRR